MERIEYQVELELTDGPAAHTSMQLPPALTKGQRLNVPVEGEFVQAEVIEVTKLTTEEPIRWKLLAREVEKPPAKEGSIPIDRLTASNDDCIDTMCRSVFISFSGMIGVPNAFSPNGDGINDEVRVEGKGITQLMFRIFNRWGELVFETTDKREGWNGMYKGALQEMDAYTYTVQATLANGKFANLKGNITLLR